MFDSVPDVFKNRIRLLHDRNTHGFDAWVSLISAAEGMPAVSGIFLIVSFNIFTVFDTASPFLM